MAKRIKYKIGDVFLIPLKDDLKGIGRVLKKDESTVLIELYNIKPLKVVNEYDFEEATKKEPLVIHWSYDDALRKGIWEIIDNQPVPKEIDMPYFWTQDAGDMKYYIYKGSQDSYEISGGRKEISKEEIMQYNPYGIGNEISEVQRYMRKLRQVGLLMEDL